MIKLLLVLLKSKALFSAGTMLLSVIVYAWIWGWPYAVGFVVLLFVHEMGHFLAARQRGMNVGVPTFIPFVGAWIQLKDMPHDSETEAYVGIAGPVLGTLGALACYYAGREIDSGLLLALAYAGFMLNLFNLVPLSPLDGGRITQVISPRIWLFGAPILVALFFWHPSPIFLVIALLSWPQLLKAWKGMPPENAPYYQVPLQTRINYGVAYIGLIAFLGAMSYSLHQNLEAAYQH